MPDSKLSSFFSPLLSCFSLGSNKREEPQGPEFGILTEGEEQYSLSGAEGDTLDLNVGSYCRSLAKRYSTRSEMRNAVRVSELHLMREPRRRRFVDSAAAVPYDGAGGYRQEQDFDRDGVELDYWQKVPEREAEYLVVGGMDHRGTVGYVRLERQWMWERAPPQGGQENYDSGVDDTAVDTEGEDEEDMSTWRPRRSVGVSNVIINKQTKLQRQRYGKRDLELGMVTFGAYGGKMGRERERGEQGENEMYLYELALLALAAQRVQKGKKPWRAECRRRLREGNYARLLFDMVERRSHSMFTSDGEVWYEGSEQQEDIDRMRTIGEYLSDLGKFEQKVIDRQLRERRKEKGTMNKHILVK